MDNKYIEKANQPKATGDMIAIIRNYIYSKKICIQSYKPFDIFINQFSNDPLRILRKQPD